MTAGTRSQVLADFERYAFELLLVTCLGSDDGPRLPNRVLGPSVEEVSEHAASLYTSPQARVVRRLVEEHADEIRRCVLESSSCAHARGRVAVWVRRSVPAAHAAIAAEPGVDLAHTVSLASA